MEEDFRKGEECPQLLDLIPNMKDWMVKEVGGGGKEFGVSEEKKLELRLGLPGVEDWPAVMEKAEEQSIESVLSPGRYNLSKISSISPPSIGAKRGFLDKLEPKTEVFQRQQQQHPGFLQLQTEGKESSKKTNARAEQQSLERKACGSSGAHRSAALPSGSASGANNNSQTR